MADSGYIKLHRKLLKWCWWHDRNTRDLFIYLLLAANWEDKPYENITVKRGQLLTSVTSLSKNVGISAQSVRTSLTRLKSTGEITCKSTNRWTLITVEKYEKYQVNTNKSTNKSTNKLTNAQQTGNKRVTTTKEDIRIIFNKSVKKAELTLADRLTDEEYDSLEARLEPGEMTRLLDTLDDKLRGRVGEIEHPYNYCLEAARNMGLIP